MRKELAIAVLAYLLLPAQQKQPTLHFKFISHEPTGLVILAETKTLTYTLACEDKGDSKMRELCGNFRPGQDYTPIMRVTNSFLFDDPEGSKDESGSSYAVTMRIVNEAEK
jgi:hypothetical protein